MTATSNPMGQLDLLDMADADESRERVGRSQLDQLLEESRLYRSGADYLALLDFVVRLRNFAPFNAMLLQIQKPGLMYAASARDWRTRFGRQVVEGARPLVILWPFAPVALVYDVVDTEGRALPVGVNPFTAKGFMGPASMERFQVLLARKQIEWVDVDGGDGSAGRVKVVHRGAENGANGRGKPSPSTYSIQINRSHPEAVRFATLAHELAHLLLGHLGRDRVLKVPSRPPLEHAQEEIEAESVAYLVCRRQGIEPSSSQYLSAHVEAVRDSEPLDLYQVLRAAGQVENLLGLEYEHQGF